MRSIIATLYDTIEWAASQPWSNGKVGMIGESYYAAPQLRLPSRRFRDMDKPPSAEFYKRRAAIAAMAFRYAKHHPGIDYGMAAIWV